jgi:predicted O-linked N-acetylglucosamine transferase (SPINDLY family)
MVASVLSAVGMHDWIAESRDEYVEIARGWSTRLDEIDHLRKSLRARVAASPLTDAAAFTAALESAYREMWRAWCLEARPG